MILMVHCIYYWNSLLSLRTFNSLEVSDFINAISHLRVKDHVAVDQENAKLRNESHYPSLFGLYPLLSRSESFETRTPVPPPTEHTGLRILVKVPELRYTYMYMYKF